MKKYFFELRIVVTIVACLAASVALVGCGKENDDDVGDGPLLTEIIFDEGGGITYGSSFEYDNQNRITKMTNYDYWGEDFVNTFSYNSEGDLTSLTWGDYVGTITFTKSGNTITLNNDRWGDVVFELNAQGLLGKYTREGSIYTYQYQGKNLTIMTEDYDEGDDYKTFTTSTFTYDDKKSPFYHCKTPQWYFVWRYDGLFGNQNNPKTTIFTRDGSVRGTYTFEYTYNDDGFPTTITFKESFGDDDDDDVRTTNITLKYTD